MTNFDPNLRGVVPGQNIEETAIQRSKGHDKAARVLGMNEGQLVQTARPLKPPTHDDLNRLNQELNNVAENAKPSTARKIVAWVATILSIPFAIAAAVLLIKVTSGASLLLLLAPVLVYTGIMQGAARAAQEKVVRDFEEVHGAGSAKDRHLLSPTATKMEEVTKRQEEFKKKFAEIGEKLAQLQEKLPNEQEVAFIGLLRTSSNDEYNKLNIQAVEDKYQNDLRNALRDGNLNRENDKILAQKGYEDGMNAIAKKLQKLDEGLNDQLQRVKDLEQPKIAEKPADAEEATSTCCLLVILDILFN